MMILGGLGKNHKQNIRLQKLLAFNPDWIPDTNPSTSQGTMVDQMMEERFCGMEVRM